MRTVLSEEQVARRGAVGCGDVSQARGAEGVGVVRVVRRVRWGVVEGVVGVGIVGGKG